jgi:hypothetical protein
MHWILRRVTYANVASTLALFVALGGTAYAANGGAFILGGNNTASTSTNLTNTGSNPVLKLYAKSGQSSLAVNSKVKVGNLNADLLDGVDSTSFALTGGKTGLIFGDNGGTGEAAATCPAGTRLTGGGAAALGADNVVFISAPEPTVGQGWVADATPSNEDLVAVAICYNPRGSVPGAASASQIAALHQRMLHRTAH